MDAELFKKIKIASEFCSALEDARNRDKEEFIDEMIRMLPGLYLEFLPDNESVLSDLDYGYYTTYVDEEFYEAIRRNVEILMGEDDVFLETFEEDMKYSDTPIAASISESLADIFQPLYNFISVVKESDGEEAEGAMMECRENFEAYWSQTLCNVLRAINNLKFRK